MKIGAKVIAHACYAVFQMAEVAVPPSKSTKAGLFCAQLGADGPPIWDMSVQISPSMWYAAMRSFAIALTLLLFTPALASPPDPWSMMELLKGHWRQDQEGAVNEEVWMDSSGNLIVGMSRTVKGLSTQFEFLRIENRKTGIIYVAMPQGRRPTTFALERYDSQTLVFVNKANRWPQRIEYRRTGTNTLEATVGNLAKGKERNLTFKWTRVK